MNSDSFTELTRTSYGQNIGNSFKGIFVGILLLIGSIILLWWNEGRSVEQATALKEMNEKIITLPDTKYDAALDGKAVLVQGLVKPLSEVIDPEFGVRTDGLVLKKTAQMYQWKENTSSKSEDKLGGGTETVTTYEYVKEWSSMQINSSSFKHPSGHQNPMMNYKSQTYTTDAQLGDFHLDRSMVSHIGASQGYGGLAELPEQIGAVKNYKSFLYVGESPNAPKVGDVRITYKYAPSAIYTYAAKEQSKSLTPYVTNNGKSFVFVRSGKVAAQTIFKEELDANATLTWILRVVGLSLMFVAFSMMMNIIETFAKVIPMLGTLVGGVTGIIAGILTLILGPVIIALAWFSSRPIMSLMIIAVGIGIAVLLGKFAKKKQAVPAGKHASSTPHGREKSTTPPQRESTYLSTDEDAASSEEHTATPPPRKH